jgi:predicted ATPase/DNA-binding CsgD family transcriptional regulator
VVTSVDIGAVSARESEVLVALGDHLTNAEIAQRLHISVRTVESHVSSLLRKLEAADRRDLAERASQLPPSGSAGAGVVAGLPGTWTTFVGRRRELDELEGALATDRLVTVLGPGGIGKTRLVVTAAERAAPSFSAGGAFVNLVPVRPEFVVEAVAAALGVMERPQQPLEQAVFDRLRTGRTLLVLDNCEHVLGAVASFTAGVLASCPAAVVLATSRERMGVIGERVLTLGPLAVGPDGARHVDGSSVDVNAVEGSPVDVNAVDGNQAEALFVDRAFAGAPARADRAVVTEICRRLEGMPLAIELAAARCASLGVDGVLAGLDDRLRLLSRSGVDTDRHRSMRTVIEWSHGLLDDDERSMLRRVSVFAGAFDLDSATQVAGDGEVAVASDVIGRLTDKSLLVHNRARAGQSRWRMLDTVQAYARERLDESGEKAETLARYVRWATGAARELEHSVENDGAWPERFDLVSDDLREALRAATDGGADATAFELAMALGHLCYARRFLVEGRDHFAEAVELAPDDAAAVEALRTEAGAAFAEMRGELAYELLCRGVTVAAEAGDRRVAGLVLAQAAAIAGRCPALFVTPLGRDEILAQVEEARALAPPDDLEVAAHVAVAAAWADYVDSPTIPRRGPAAEALALARRLDDPVLTSAALDALANAAAGEGRYKEGSRYTAERLALLDRLPRGDPRVGGEVVDIFHMATESAIAAGELSAALMRARSSRHDSTSQGLPHLAAAHVIVPLALLGLFDEVLVQADIMLEGWERAGRPTAGWMSPSFYAVAFVHGARGEHPARARWRALADELAYAPDHPSGRFFDDRLDLLVGRVDDAESSIDAEAPCTGPYSPYARAMAVERAVVAGRADAADRLAATRPLVAENDFAVAMLDRAEGRLRDDDAALRRALAGWEALGARFERACTLLLLDGAPAEGAEELAALGVVAEPTP